MEAMIASNFLDCRAGMMPSQSLVTKVHSVFIWTQSALAMSISKPVSSPLDSRTLKGGYAPSVPMTSLSWAEAAPAKSEIVAIDAAANKRVEIFIIVLSVGRPATCSRFFAAGEGHFAALVFL
ncbi:hypothetical protein D3C87_1609780 [compost metagenome]